MSRIVVGILYGQGINADVELGWAFERAGAEPLRVHVLDLLREPGILDRLQILAFPGGFSFGDHLGAGRVLALELQEVQGRLKDFLGRGLILGICNGFQVLVKLGLLPMTGGHPEVEASLAVNESGRFVDRWVNVVYVPDSVCVWTRGLGAARLPVRHGEGRFVADRSLLDRMQLQGQVALRYAPGHNPNGSLGDIAGVCDPTGRAFGLMPHPEAFLERSQYPDRRRVREVVTGLEVFRNAVSFLKSSS